MIRRMVPEAQLKQTEHGLFAGGEGWFVLSMRDVRWWYRGHGFEAGLSGDGDFPQIGIGLTVLGSGEPMTMYHWETDQEDFLLLAGDALLIIEGEERPLRQWDFVHCPPETRHAIVGAGAPAGDRRLGRLHGGRGGAPSRHRGREGNDRRGRGIRSVSGTGADAIPRRLASRAPRRLNED